MLAEIHHHETNDAPIRRAALEYTIARLHKTDPALLALRRDWLPLAVSFLHYAFKQKHEVQLGHDLFRERLDAYLEHVNAGLAEDARYRHDADHYINVWSRDADLIRIRNREDGHVVMLSPYAERLLGWFEDMQFRGVVGTESRLRNILRLTSHLLDAGERVNQSHRYLAEHLQRVVDTRNLIESRRVQTLAGEIKVRHQ